MPLDLRPIDEDEGDHMTLREFMDNCKAKLFIDYDGFACYATANEVSSIEVRPSNVMRNEIDACWSHVVWYNR